MKFSIILTVLILAFGAGFIRKNHLVLATARDFHQGTTDNSEVSIKVTNHSATKPRERRKPELRARFVLDAYAEHLREYERLQMSGELQKREFEMREHFLDLIDRATCLNDAELKILVADLRTDKLQTEEAGSDFIRSIIRALAKDRPALALEFLFDEATTPVRLFQFRSENLIDSCIKSLAGEDSSAALAWLKKCEGKISLIQMERAKRALITGVAAQDPRSAFRLIGEVGIEDPAGDGIDVIIDSCKTPEQLTNALAGLPIFLDTIGDEKKRTQIRSEAMHTFAVSAAMMGYDSGSKWIASANLSADEIIELAWSLDTDELKKGEIGKWAQWIRDNSPAATLDESIQAFVFGWVRNDYRAAAGWIQAAPDGPMKNSAIQAYAETISEYEPSAAVPWAETLPAGSQRDSTLDTIRKNWAEKDAEGAAAFALKYGIK